MWKVKAILTSIVNVMRAKIIHFKWLSWLHGCYAVLLLLRLSYKHRFHYCTSWMFSRDRNREKTSFTTTIGSYLITALAQVFIPSFMWLKHVACHCAAADPRHKRPTVQQRPGHLLTPSTPISISGLAERPICSRCRPAPANCVQCIHGSSPEASREAHRSTQTVWESVSTGRHKHHHTYETHSGVLHIPPQMMIYCTSRQEACHTV